VPTEKAWRADLPRRAKIEKLFWRRAVAGRFAGTLSALRFEVPLTD
jgi:hypothetical protein